MELLMRENQHVNQGHWPERGSHYIHELGLNDDHSVQAKGGDKLRKLWLIVPALLPAIVLLVMALSAAPTARADGGPHVKGWGATPSDCASCHRGHRASCHATAVRGSTLNVMAGPNEADGGPLRAGGFETARINTKDPSLSP